MRPPRERRAFSTFGGALETAGAPEESRFLGGLFRLDRHLDRALTHGFHSYAGRMHPSIARRAIAHFTRPGQAILDPFCGSGTVLVEALAAGRLAVGRDASALAVALASVRTNVLGAVARERLVSLGSEVADASAAAARGRKRMAVPAWATDERRHFEPHVAFELYGLRARVFETPEDDVGKALRLVLSALLPKFMRRAPDELWDEEAPRRVGRGVPSGFFAAKTRELAAGLATLESASPAGTSAPEVRLGDARSYPELASGRFALVLASPPYAGTYDYADEHAVRFRWLGFDEGPLRRHQLGARGATSRASAETWRAGRRAWLLEMRRVLAPGGHVALVVGDGVLAGAPEDVVAETTAAAEPIGLAFVARASQTRPLPDRRLRVIFGDRPRREHIVLLRRA